MQKAIFLERAMSLFKPKLGDKGINTLPNGLCPKVNVMVLELAYLEAVVQHVICYATSTSFFNLQ